MVLALFVASILLVDPSFAQWSISLLSSRTTNIQDSVGDLSYNLDLDAPFTVNSAEKKVDAYFLQDGGEVFFFNAYDVSSWGTPLSCDTISFSGGDHLLAVSVTPDDVTEPGTVVFFNVFSGKVRSTATVGAYPIKVRFTPDQDYLIVANAGKPGTTVDPYGGATVIKISEKTIDDLPSADVVTTTFVSFTSLPTGMVQANPGVSVSRDLQPASLAIRSDSEIAYITLQQNNGIAVLDIDDVVISRIFTSGMTDHAEVPFDASDMDNEIRIREWPGVLSLRQPGGIAAIKSDGNTYLLTTNQGSSENFETYNEVERVSALPLDPTVFETSDSDDENLGRLKVLATLGKNRDGLYSELYAFGSRSFSVFKPNGTLVGDTRAELEFVTAIQQGLNFNSDMYANDFDTQSPEKGPEPVNVVAGKVDGITHAFVINQRIGGVTMWNLCQVDEPLFEAYFNNRDFSVNLSTSTGFFEAGDIGPAGVIFVDDNNPTGKYLLVVTGKLSGTVSVYEISGNNAFPCDNPASLLSLSPLVLLLALFFSFFR